MAAIILTNRCNLSCPVCLRPPRPGSGTRALSFAQLEVCLDELAAIGQTTVCYTGGEPGLWSDGAVGIGEILAATALRGLAPMVATNGYIFRDAAAASALLDGYFELTDRPLQVHLGIDHWHAGTWRDGLSPALEAALRWRDALQTQPNLALGIVSLWCLDDARNMRREEFARYLDAGVPLHYVPVSPLASPAMLGRLAPKLRPSGTDKTTLGSYGDILRARLGVAEHEWSMLENMALLGPCQAVDTLTLDIDGSWWLCNDRAGRTMRVAAAEDLSGEAVADCLARNPLVALFRRRGFAQTLRDCESDRGPFDAAATAPVLARYHPYGTSGRAACGLCRSLPAELHAFE